MTTPYERSKAFSNEKRTAIRQGLSGVCNSQDVVLTCGSYARREASANSDIDFFVITNSEADPTGIDASAAYAWVEKAKEIISNVVPLEPSSGGAFAKIVNRSSMLKNVGGDNDTNQTITRRMLFLLEGDALFNSTELQKVRREILERYIADSITDHQLALLLLNDVVRYYRTMAVDYEFKSGEGEHPKLGVFGT